MAVSFLPVRILRLYFACLSFGLVLVLFLLHGPRKKGESPAPDPEAKPRFWEEWSGLGDGNVTMEASILCGLDPVPPEGRFLAIGFVSSIEMGTSASKPSKNGVLLLCKYRIEHTKQVIDSRYALSAAHLSYIQSLRSFGAALRQFAEADLLVESALSTSEVDKSPSHSSYASPSPSRFVECVGSPLSASPLTPTAANVSYMRATGASSINVTLDHQSANHFVGEDSLTFPLPPPPPPPPLDVNSSWDFFDPRGVAGKVSMPTTECHQTSKVSRMVGLIQIKEAEVAPFKEESLDIHKEKMTNHEPQSTDSVWEKSHKDRETELAKEICPEREDFSEFITHRAKDFVSSMRDIENRFLRAAEDGDEVSRMLETKRIKLGISTETIGKHHAYSVLVILSQVCCTGETSQKYKDSNQNAVKIITWNRSISSLSSSSKSPLATATNDDAGDVCSDFVDEFSMISGSHSSTLERLYAWERKLYDEIKASEHIRRTYDQKCNLLRHQIARDSSAAVIDKTRAVVKDLHSRLRVAIHSVDSISKRIEKMRDEELLPQLMELVQGLTKMWKAMLECHHTQFIKISLAYHAKTLAAATQSEVYKQALIHLERELEYFGSRFLNWDDAHKSYLKALNGWLQKCILQPQERRKGRKKPLFPPRQAISPPIFVVCSDWLSGLNSLRAEELLDSIKGTVLVIHNALEHQVDYKELGKVPDEPEKNGVPESKEDGNCEKHLNLDDLQASLTRVFDRLTKFSEGALKVYEDVKQSNEIASVAYSNTGMRYLL
ncbi:hypothetical protein ZIOFF_063785 [Zingiber officinale]|uniref:Uncharacterized protein n=2 Tax=Zingiber officinale TaxID=94328 RepID=A0A8J5F2C8_ZINOF|nr:hypothetical protein ZIOFF_063785 [Zingiber officinale]